MNFFGIEGNIAKAHGPRRDILFINECNRKITYEIYDQLATRTQGTVFLDFNPDCEFWLHEKVLPNFKHTLIKSNFINNPWLPEKELQNILAKREKPGFENWWKVYGLGELGASMKERYSLIGSTESSIIVFLMVMDVILDLMILTH